MKGSSTMMTGLRQWQDKALRSFGKLRQPADFIVSATPGSGKTTLAITLAKRLLAAQDVKRVVVVVPTDALRQQWADAAGRVGLHLMPVSVPEDYIKEGYQGCVVTYAQMARGAGSDMIRQSTRVPTMAILDEIHHAGANRSWGEGLQHALELAKYRLALTGTPWRQDPTSRIPFVQYDATGLVTVDFKYEYGQAVADGVCRRAEFHAYDGEGRWIDCGKVSQARLGADLDDDDVSGVLDAVYHPSSDWMPTLLREADNALDELRHDVLDAGGLVVADRQWHAHAYADILAQITGVRPVVVVSDELDSKAIIDTFRDNKSKWIVAVRMVSEGVDIPRLGICVFASKIQTPLFFRQVVGRIVRTRPGEEFNARLFIPSVPALALMAHEIEQELRHQLDLERERDEKAHSDAAAGQQTFELREPLSASDAVFGTAILSGDTYTADELAEADAACIRSGIPTTHRVAVARLQREQGHVTQTLTITPTPEVAPRHRHEKALRSEIESTARKIDHRNGDKPGTANIALCARFGPRKSASVSTLEQMLAHLAELW